MTYGGLGLGGWGRGRLLGMAQERVGAAGFLRLVDELEGAEEKTRVVGAKEEDFSLHVGRMARDLVALFRISSVINSIKDVKTLQCELMGLIGEVVPARYGAVVLGPGEAADVCQWTREPDGAGFEVRRELVQRALWEREQISNEGDDGATEQVICVPLVAIERTLGALYLGGPAGGELFREDHRYFLDSVSRIAAVTLENLLALDELRRENRSLKRALTPAVQMIGRSKAMAKVETFVTKVARSDTTVLIRGESGTGKEVVARAIHAGGARAEKPFVAINCAAIPETLIESELFGNEKGAFTGAVAQRKGKFEMAEDGTVFLDEVGELAMPMQAKLLRVLQQREFERVGGTKTLKLEARVLAATNKDLEVAIKAGEFRQDLYYRLNVVSVVMPSLREHREDVALLALHFAVKFAAKGKRAFKGISSRGSDAADAL